MKIHCPAPVVMLQMKDGSQVIGWVIGYCDTKDKIRLSSFHDGATYCDGQWHDVKDVSVIVYLSQGDDE